ncbi:MAG TPA: hypothetical protein VE972_13300 [Conexibacter sp.]|nr:hypothetical protein [Conexibacter sp.]
MPDLQASRRLVKSPPELWAEVSDAGSLARHLGELGEIRITRLEPETTVAWEGERASGTIELAPAGWGTSVTFTAEPVAIAEPEPAVEAEPEPEPAAELPRRSWLRSLLRRRDKAVAIAEPEITPEPEPEPEPVTEDPVLAALTGALDSLGSAHHRPFSRA